MLTLVYHNLLSNVQLILLSLTYTLSNVSCTPYLNFWVQPLHFSNPLKYIGQSLPLPSPPYYWPSMHLV